MSFKLPIFFILCIAIVSITAQSTGATTSSTNLASTFESFLQTWFQFVQRFFFPFASGAGGSNPLSSLVKRDIANPSNTPLANYFRNLYPNAFEGPVGN